MCIRAHSRGIHWPYHGRQVCVCVCSNAEAVGESAVLGEAALVRSTLAASGQPAVQVFQEDLAALPDVPAMQAALSELLGGLLPVGECAATPILEEEPDVEVDTGAEATADADVSPAPAAAAA